MLLSRLFCYGRHILLQRYSTQNHSAVRCGWASLVYTQARNSH